MVASDDNSEEPEGGQEDPRELETDDRESEREEDPIELERHDREPEEEDSTDAPAPRRTSTRKTRRPDYYGSQVYAATDPQKEPQTVKEALNCSEKEQWQAEMQEEMDSIYTNGV